MPCNYQYGCMWPHCFCEEGMCEQAVPASSPEEREALLTAVNKEIDGFFDEVKGGRRVGMETSR